MTAPSLAPSSVKEEWVSGKFSGTYLGHESASWAGETFVLYIFNFSSKGEEKIQSSNLTFRIEDLILTFFSSFPSFFLSRSQILIFMCSFSASLSTH